MKRLFRLFSVFSFQQFAYFEQRLAYRFALLFQSRIRLFHIENADDRHTGAEGGDDPGIAVLEHEALLRKRTGFFCGLEKDIRGRLSVADFRSECHMVEFLVKLMGIEGPMRAFFVARGAKHDGDPFSFRYEISSLAPGLSLT